MKSDRGLTIARMVELGQVSRSGFYRFDDDAKPGPDPDMELRDAIQRIALEWPSYGPATDHGGTAPARLEGEPQTGSPHPARG